ncbi:MAG: tetratricopeptide repeat protein [Candidatus Lustribacter sp.]|jgi:tetratricopeptide (TPR) repeat protein
MSARFVAHRLGLAVLASLLLATTGCAAQISSWIVQTRNHQGDVALDHQNSADASIAYQLALRVQPTNAHARAGLVAVQARIAQTLFTASRFDDAVKALDVANRYAPSDPRIEALRTQIEQAEVKRDIVVSNYPAYRETGAGLRTSFEQLRTEAADIATTLHRFDYTYDSSELTQAIQLSYELNSQVTRLTDRLIQYRQLVDSGVPENAETAIAAPASLLPLP